LKALQEGRYKAAINGYKALINKEQRPVWIEALAKAYEGRAWELAAKDMFKEAAAIWRNRAQCCDQPVVEIHFLQWLIQAGDIDEALTLFQSHRQALGSKSQQFDTYLAVLALSGRHGILPKLQEDDPIVRDYSVALQALEAYCEGDAPTLSRALERISFRSPYRDLRTLLKALLEQPKDPGQAIKMLERIDNQSAFAHFAHVIGISTYDGEQLLSAMAPLEQISRNFILDLKGWSHSHRGFLQELIALHQSSVERHLLRFLVQHKEILGDNYCRRMAMLLILHHPESIRAHDRAFGEPSSFQKYRILALLEEKEKESPYNEFDAWNDVLDYFQEEFDTGEHQNALRAALILRRMANILEKTHIDRDDLLDSLQQSLKFDPDDPPTYLRLIRLYREDKRFKEARRIQEQALARYPRDTEVLLAIVETSIASNAFKKAANFAHRILEIDPINPKIRKILFNAHLSHARKQIIQNKTELALKELDLGAQWDNTEQARLQIDLIRGIMELGHNTTLGRKRLQGIMASLAYSLKGRFLLLMEADRLQRQPARILRLSKLPRIKADSEQVMELIYTLKDLPEQDESCVKNALSHLLAPLKKLARASYTEAEMELICEVFKRFDQVKLRQLYAQAALRQWPETPLFVYHRLDSQDYLIPYDYHILEDAMEQARESGDMRTAHRIGELLRPSMPFTGPGFPKPGPVDHGEFAALMEEIINEVGPEGFLDVLEDMGIEEIGKMRKQIGDGQLADLLEDLAKRQNRLEDSPSPFINPFKKSKRRHQGSTKKKDANDQDDDNHQPDLF
jgi:tetratricopeptide (TPR) repeat protein